MASPFLTINFLADILESIKQIDYYSFTLINSKLTNSFFDSILPFTRESLVWVPLYLFFMIFLFVNYGHKAWGFIMFLLLGILITDQVASHFFKPLVQRLRPCSDPTLQIPVRLLLQGCSGGFSFMSSHAANHFGMATLTVYTFRSVLKNYAWILYAWAFVISYAQVYVGVHFPIDVLCGGVLGYLTGRILANIYSTRFPARIEF